MDVITLILTLFHATASIFHCMGLFLLMTVKRTRLSDTNNMVLYSNFVLLTLLSTWELLFSTSNASLRIIRQFVNKEHTRPVRFYFDTITMGLSFSTIYLMTLNRLLGSLYPFWYIRWMTKRRFLCVVLSVTSLISTIMIAGNIMGRYGDPLSSFVGEDVMVPTVYLSYFVFCVTTYILIFKKILESRRNTRTNTGNESSSETGFKFFLRELKQGGYVISLLITFTYLLFVVIPVMVGLVCTFADGCSDTSRLVWQIFYILNNISDALVYVLCDRDIQNHMKSLFARWRRDEQNGYRTRDTDLSVVSSPNA